jgi:hypothetical protein
LGWTKELRATGRAIAAWHRGAARTADLAVLRSAVRNMVHDFGGCRGEIVRSVEVEVVMLMLD